MDNIREEVKTFVIFDTETTGLPSSGNNPKITELCFIAITRDELVTKQTAPRVLNKLSICIKPGKRIGDIASQVSGLRNDDLESMPSFQRQASLVTRFLTNLPQPACLVAHNGNRFDFPLLVSELQTAAEDVPDVLCADSIEAFRKLDDDDALLQNAGHEARNGATPPKLKRKYSLQSVYDRTFGQQPEAAHTAEDDCLNLLKIVLKKLQKFLQWCDQHALPLKHTNPMY